MCTESQEKEEWCCLGLGKCVYFAGEILFPHWKPRGQFLHILIWHNNICKIFYCPRIIREAIHMAKQDTQHQPNTGLILAKNFAGIAVKGPRKILITCDWGCKLKLAGQTSPRMSFPLSVLGKSFSFLSFLSFPLSPPHSSSNNFMHLP